MYKILEKKVLGPQITKNGDRRAAIARKAEPGQFIILRIDEQGEAYSAHCGGFRPGNRGQ